MQSAAHPDGPRALAREPRENHHSAFDTFTARVGVKDAGTHAPNLVAPDKEQTVFGSTTDGRSSRAPVPPRRQCRRKIEMTPGAQSRNDTPSGGGYDRCDTTLHYGQTLGEGERDPELPRMLPHPSM